MDIGVAHFLLPRLVHQRIQLTRQGGQHFRPIRRFVLQIAPKGFRPDLLVHPSHQKRFGRRPQIQIGLQLPPQPLDIQQRFLQQHQLRLDFDVKPPAHFKQPHQNQTEGNFGNRLVEHRLAHCAYRRFQLLRPRFGRHPARLDVRRGDTVVVAVEESQKVNRQITLVVIRQAADDAEIQRDIAVVGRHQNIARMHIGMEEAVAEHLREKSFHAVFRQLVQILPLRPQGGNIGNRRAVHPFDGQHVVAAIIVKHLRHNQHFAVFEIAAELAAIGRFAHQIQLVVQILVEFVHHFARPQAFAVGKQPLHPTRTETQQC